MIKSQRFWVSVLIVILMAVLFIVPAVADDGSENEPLQRVRLREFSRKMNRQWIENRLEAEERAKMEGIPIRKEFPDGRVIELQRYLGDMPLYYTTWNLQAAQTVSSDTVWPGGDAGLALTGINEILGVWDQGQVRTTHQEFQGRVTHQDGNSTLSDHATHVAGTMIAAGVVNNARGMSYQANVHSYDWNSDLGEMADEAADGMGVSNHSYGYATGWFYNYRDDDKWVWLGIPEVSETEDFSYGFYNAIAAEWDDFACNAPYFLPVVAAGNDRNYGPLSQPVEHWVRQDGDWVLSETVRQRNGGPDGYDCISYFSLSKNVLSVGAVQEITGGFSVPGDVIMSTFSSWGPTDDGRIKPDIVAKGVSTYSASSSGDSNYVFKSGTSMASPNAAGSIGLLLQHYRQLYDEQSPRASTIKGLIIHTADSAGASPGPDYTFGWGLMNTRTAAEVMSADAAMGGEYHIFQRSLNSAGIYTLEVESDGSSPLKATICWTDPAGIPLTENNPPLPPAELLNNPQPMLVNDLDLRIYGPDSTEFRPWVLDHTNPSLAASPGDNYRDNVEQVSILSPQAGIYTIQISHKGTLQNGSQDYSLVVTGNSTPTRVSASVWTLY